MGREALQPQSPGGRRPRGWKSLIELAFAAMAFRFGALRYGAPKRSIRIGGSQPWSSRRGVDPRPLIPTALSNDRLPRDDRTPLTTEAGLSPRGPARQSRVPVDSRPGRSRERYARRRRGVRPGPKGCNPGAAAPPDASIASAPRRGGRGRICRRPNPAGRTRSAQNQAAGPGAASGKEKSCCGAAGMTGEHRQSTVSSRVQAPFWADRSKAWITCSIFRPSAKSTTRDGAPPIAFASSASSMTLSSLNPRPCPGAGQRRA